MEIDNARIEAFNVHLVRLADQIKELSETASNLQKEAGELAEIQANLATDPETAQTFSIDPTWASMKATQTEQILKTIARSLKIAHSDIMVDAEVYAMEEAPSEMNTD